MRTYEGAGAGKSNMIGRGQAAENPLVRYGPTLVEFVPERIGQWTECFDQPGECRADGAGDAYLVADRGALRR